MDDTIKSFRDLVPWQSGMELALRVHGATAAFPQEGDEIGARMRDASITIPSAISEAFAMESTAHLIGVVAPLAELETCIELARRLDFLAVDLADDLAARVECIAQSIGTFLAEVDPELDPDDDGDYPGRPQPEVAPRRPHRRPPERLHRQPPRGPRPPRDDYECDCEPRRPERWERSDDRYDAPRRPRRYHPDDWY